MCLLREKFSIFKTHKVRERQGALFWLKRAPAVFFLVVLGLFGTVDKIQAATYTAITSDITVTIQAGTAQQVTLNFKNTGTGTWTRGRGATALYLYGDTSIFGHASWLTNDLPGLITQATVKPGQTASATFWVKAPPQAGVYEERFLLSYGLNQWVKGSVAHVKFVVLGAAATPASSVTTKPPSTAYQAELTEKGGLEWQLGPGARGTVVLGFKNTGTAVWTNSGRNYVSIYTGTRSRKSAFQDAGWKNAYQPVVMKEATVKPGQIGHFEFQLKAPTEQGSYQEDFLLAAEDVAWITNSIVSLPIKVATNIATPAPAPISTYKGMLMLASAKQLSLAGNGRMALTFGIKNTGTATWGSLSAQVTGVQAASMPTATVRDETWLSAVEAAKAQGATPPGQIGFIAFTVKAPAQRGEYKASFKLVADGQDVQEAIIDIPITVTADGVIQPEPSVPTQTNPDTTALPDEPIIRVGLYATTDDRSVIKAVSGGFSLYQNGTAVCTFTSGQEVTLVFDRTNKIYKASGPGCATQSSNYYVAYAPDALAPLEVTDFSRPVSWLPGANDNKFRGKLELRYTPSSDSVWLINELPIEWYLKGIAETSNSSPQEYQKALLTAARTYAMYHVRRGTKHADEYYTVDAKYDQVYRGYGAESRDPAVVSAVDATRGKIVTYNGNLAITPYYSRSDGRTRSWTEVWGGGPYPWLVSVQVPWDAGRTLWGHGVGLSATGALGMAAEGKTWEQILKWFYTGIELKQVYK